MIRFGCQQALDGPTVALLGLITFFCLEPAVEQEERAGRVLLMYVARALESLDPVPSTWSSMQMRLHIVLESFPNTEARLSAYLDAMLSSLDSLDGLADLMYSKLPDCLDMIQEETTQIPAFPLDRRSYLGLFVRRARLSYEMLLDRDRLQLLHLCTAWRDGVENTVADEWQASEPAKVYRAWRDSERRGNYTMTKNQLHAFFDYTLPGCDKEMHQHALLNLARFHMLTKGYRASRAALDEAILLSRTVGDTECMRACDHLLDQLAYLDPQPSQANVLTQRDTDDTLKNGAYAPLTLWKADMDRERGKPLLGLVQRLHDATWKAREAGASSEAAWEPRPSIERSAACPSAVLARLWLQIGVPSVAEVYLAHVHRMRLTPPENWTSIRLEATITAAFEASERGDYEEALVMLMEPQTLECVTKWWESTPVDTEATALMWLQEARALMEAQQPHQCLEILMKALATSDAQQLYPARRTCLCMLADVMIMSLDMHTEAQALLDEILPSALADPNGERRGHVRLVQAKWALATHQSDMARNALRNGMIDFQRTETWREEATCTYLAAHLAEEAGDHEEASELRAQYATAKAKADKASSAPCEAQLTELETLVYRLGNRCSRA
ncbi:anaphase-promoting complex subunit 5 [Malassezia pachydermatis]|uniref:Anaphase-promoting complex subunit 5 n=1 Tax=Malassezia pachydermatis TaxID=77020 RepID=A0A0M9VPF1_9BASI|nr:anaphase-promoting complex subunit 5 [Malassezia pachydermatis]KOS14365.1 anaphase-promoting complex subunit 5 [Malassezia pachydermatis]